MRKGTSIRYKGSEYNPDGDRPINLKHIPSIKSKEELKKAIADKEMHFIHVTGDKMYGIDKLVYKRQKFLLLEPNPVTFYFSLAFDAVQQLDTVRKKLEETLIADNDDHLKAVLFSHIFRIASVSSIFSFLALEAFLNQLLPDHQLIEYKGKGFTKNRIQRWVPFEEKLTIIIPTLCHKNFGMAYPKRMEKIIELKRMRDNLTHLKEITNGFTSYNEVYQDILDTNFKSMVFAVKSCINFYNPKLIINYKLKTRIK
ncbi:hypothetical protein [Flavobacterium sp.]|uniref:hypothetical protein n=1 Tax=Flavobacterium sp. TaxID=239 RepID=UPI0039197238